MNYQGLYNVVQSSL